MVKTQQCDLVGVMEIECKEFARILNVPCQGVCMFSTEWSISSLPTCIDPNPTIYLPPIEDPKVVHDTIFYERPPGKIRKVKGNPVVLDPYQMVISKVKLDFKSGKLFLAKMLMESVTKSDVMVLPYGMLLTRLYRHVHSSHSYAISDLHSLVDHVMIPLTEGKMHRVMIDEKRPHL
ncbi:hypothetical protein Tco_0361022 [Tanacetum coccineum]